MLRNTLKVAIIIALLLPGMTFAATHAHHGHRVTHPAKMFKAHMHRVHR